jgi:hypothetical protein
MDRLGDADFDQPGSATRCSQRRQPRCSREALGAGDDDHPAERPLVSILGAVRKHKIVRKDRQGAPLTCSPADRDSDGKTSIVGQREGDRCLFALDVHARRPAATPDDLDVPVRGHRLPGR